MDINIIFHAPEFQDSFEEMIHKTITSYVPDDCERFQDKRKKIKSYIYSSMCKMSLDDLETLYKAFVKFERGIKDDNNE